MTRITNFTRGPAGLIAAVAMVACSGSGSGKEETGAAPVTYPPLDFTAIGAPAAIADDLLFDEGPVWAPREQALYFTDINADAIYRMTLPHDLEIYLQPAGHPDGLALDPEGRLIGAGFVSRDVFRLDGKVRTSLAQSHDGKKLNSPDDIIARSDGVIYFTDPLFGIDGSQGFSAQTEELGFQGVFRLTPDGATHLEDQTTAGPNGVQLSPDEKTLYVSYTLSGDIQAFSVAKDGSLGNKTLFANAPLADSMCVDAGGNVYVASVSGIAIFDPAGAPLGVIPVPEVPTNVAFGGPDQRTLFITARKDLVGTPTAGNSTLYGVDEMPVPGMPGRP